MSRSEDHSKNLCYLLLLVLGELPVRCVRGFGLDLGVCRDEKFDCDCGSGSGRTVPVYQKQCNFVSNWQVWCRSCENGVEVYKDDVCRRYGLCADCQPGLKACKSCPPGFYGTWCDQKCDCLNGGTCVGSSSNCVCRPGYTGSFCEFRTGCVVPATSGHVKMRRIPDLNTGVLEFHCGQNNLVLKGPARLTCDPVKGAWSDAPPTCEPVCPLPETAGNVRFVVRPVDSFVVSGDSLRFRCAEGFTLFGSTQTKCLNDSTWSSPPPSCVKLVFCRKPRPEHHTVYQVVGPTSYPPFSNGTQLSFQCQDGRLLMGQSTIECGQNGKWSAEMPTCVKVHSSEVDCNTRGYELLSDIRQRVRIRCPGGCSSGETEVWGNHIYDESSSVCRAALHAGKTSNVLGGSVLVVDTGSFSHFQGTQANGVQSKRRYAKSGSFTIQNHNNGFQLEGASKGCPKGWWRSESYCFYIVGDGYSWTEAKWMCHNLDSTLPTDAESHLLSSIVDQAIIKNRLSSFWLFDRSNDTTEEALGLGEVEQSSDSIYNGTQNDESAGNGTSGHSCYVVQGRESNFTPQSLPCEEKSPFVCLINLQDQAGVCADPGPLENGLVELSSGPADRLEIGSTLRYQCSSLFVLNGEGTATCTETGTWYSEKPRCVKVAMCSDPPVPPFGSLEIAPPIPSWSSGKSAFGSRSNRFGVVSRPKARRSTLQPDPDPEQEGRHRVGVRAFYSCRSKYYELIGSQSRRCQADGTWSGRHVSCLPLCGRSDSPRSPFIVNGNASEAGQWPWQVGIGYLFPGFGEHQLLCGGSLVAELWVLTAAHCVTEDGSLLLQDTRILEIYAGKHYRDNRKDDEFVQKRKVVEIHVHPDYDPSVFDSDIALVKLESPLELTSRVQPVCLPDDKTTRHNLGEGQKGVVTGWGLTEDAMNSESLRQAIVRVVSDQTCEQGYKEAGMPLTVSENMFCAGDDDGEADACSGDSGGPLVFQVGQGKQRHWVLEGIVSWGSLKGCGLPQQYSGFTAVHRFLDWIHLYL